MGRDHKLTVLIVNVLAVVLCEITAKPTRNYERKAQSRDLDTASSSYSQQYYDWGGTNPGGYSFGVTGNGLLNNPRLEYDPRPNTINNDGYYPEVDKTNYNGDVGYHTLGGFGGYGGNGGNGGLSSYYGYNNPYYQDANHLGFGYYKKFGYGNIYSSGVTPNLVTGYRGYSRR